MELNGTSFESSDKRGAGREVTVKEDDFVSDDVLGGTSCADNIRGKLCAVSVEVFPSLRLDSNVTGWAGNDFDNIILEGSGIAKSSSRSTLAGGEGGGGPILGSSIS